MWLTAATVLELGFIPCLWVAVRGDTWSRLIAVELGGVLTTLVLVLLTQAYQRPSFSDLALSSALLSLPAALVFAHFLGLRR